MENNLSDPTMIHETELWSTLVSKLNILAQVAFVCVSVLGFGAWFFPLHAWLCHRIFIPLHTGRSSPLLLCV